MHTYTRMRDNEQRKKKHRGTLYVDGDIMYDALLFAKCTPTFQCNVSFVIVKLFADLHVQSYSTVYRGEMICILIKIFCMAFYIN